MTYDILPKQIVALIFFLTLTCLFYLSIPFTIYIIFCTRFWWLMLIYIVWIVRNKNACETGGKSWNTFRNLKIWDVIREYYPCSIKFVDLTAFKGNKNYLFCAIPHGLLATGILNWFMAPKKLNELLPNYNFFSVTLNEAFTIPFYCTYLYAFGFIGSSASALNYVLGRPEGGNAVALCIGGAEESLLLKPGVYKSVAYKRKGFVKIAIKNGASLVPCISFGEVDLFDQITNPTIEYIQKLTKKYLGVVPIIPKGRGVLQPSTIPIRKPLNTIGKFKK